MIIDFHTHIFPDKIAAATVKSLGERGGYPPNSDGTAAGLLERIEEAGVDIAVNLPVLTKPTQFDTVAEFARKINEKRDTPPYILSFAGIHPLDPDYEEHLAYLKSIGIKGIKLHPDYQATPIDDERYAKILICARELDLITVTHTGVDSAFPTPYNCTPDRILRLLDRIGGYDRLVLAHLGSNGMYEESLESLSGCGAYFDTAFVLPEVDAALFERFLTKHGEDKLLFATDSPWRNIKHELDKIRSFGLGKATEAKILGGNAMKLLGLTEEDTQ